MDCGSGKTRPAMPRKTAGRSAASGDASRRLRLLGFAELAPPAGLGRNRPASLRSAFPLPKLPELTFHLLAPDSIRSIPRGGVPVEGRCQHKHPIQHANYAVAESAMHEAKLQRPPDRVNQQGKPPDPSAALQPPL